ncbi:hypothetical protein EO93_04405 [Methanosarcina sp. 1.H.A.2.2]|nr:hypothetical protein EO93_04405 [Methanosarcina sp. 1.H.A.2.2]
MNKTSVLVHKIEFKKILQNVSSSNTFTSGSVGVDGRTLGLMVRKNVIRIAGFDRKHQRHIYKISVHEQKKVLSILGEVDEQSRKAN